MKNSDAAILVTRYACVDFLETYGFPNPFPKDAYFLRNGPKFNGEYLSLTLKYISDFHDFTECLKVIHEDIFIILFYDSFQGKCKQWIESFPIRSVKSFADFWLIFLETWMERIDLVPDYPSIQGFKQWNDNHTNEDVDENFSLSLSSYLKSFECKSEDKIQFLDEVAKNIEKYIEVLEDQIQSYSLHDQDQSFQKNLMLDHKEKVLLPFSFGIEEENLVFENQFDSTELKSCVAEK